MKVSFYGKGDGFHGRKTASGERFSSHEFTAAHRTLPFGTRLRLKNPNNNREAIVRINDRGPYTDGRQLDVSWRVAEELGFTEQGVVTLLVEIL